MDVCSTMSLESDHRQNNGATSEHLKIQSLPGGSPPETPKDEQQSETSQQHQSSTPVSGPRCALTYSVVHAVMEKKEDGLGSRCGHTLAIVPAVAEEVSPFSIKEAA
ncbi:Serine/threonine-protein phosphatase bsl2 [Datura stramonium]|uniref:Serine/threonine-protein phosphatase bsl2 n=1 Tax=Datura stramonium TaxID=4076 RepID=A0ABS8UKJ2_DATST|nr:Serine/threonine-protein phosphatase bsl2 [Datura stramonium]